MEVDDTELERADKWMAILVSFFYAGIIILFVSIPITIIVNWDKDKEERAASFECEKAGGKWERADYDKTTSNVCMKEYTSCGPDENKPGFTVCEQKFKRIN